MGLVVLFLAPIFAPAETMEVSDRELTQGVQTMIMGPSTRDDQNRLVFPERILTLPYLMRLDLEGPLAAAQDHHRFQLETLIKHLMGTLDGEIERLAASARSRYDFGRVNAYGLILERSHTAAGEVANDNEELAEGHLALAVFLEAARELLVDSRPRPESMDFLPLVSFGVHFALESLARFPGFSWDMMYSPVLHRAVERVIEAYPAGAAENGDNVTRLTLARLRRLQLAYPENPDFDLVLKDHALEIGRQWARLGVRYREGTTRLGPGSFRGNAGRLALPANRNRCEERLK